MSERDQPDRYGPEPSYKTCPDCGAFIGSRAGCSTNGCPGDERDGMNESEEKDYMRGLEAMQEAQATDERFSAPLQDEPKCNKGTPAILVSGSGDRGREPKGSGISGEGGEE